MSSATSKRKNARRTLLPFVMLASLICFGLFRPCNASEPQAQARAWAWAIAHLRQAMKGPLETGMISALLYGLAMDYRQSRHPETERLG